VHIVNESRAEEVLQHIGYGDDRFFFSHNSEELRQQLVTHEFLVKCLPEQLHFLE
jgi:hypothetical protein